MNLKHAPMMLPGQFFIDKNIITVYILLVYALAFIVHVQFSTL